jgi:hypothetical protein
MNRFIGFEDKDLLAGTSMQSGFLTSVRLNFAMTASLVHTRFYDLPLFLKRGSFPRKNDVHYFVSASLRSKSLDDDHKEVMIYNKLQSVPCGRFSTWTLGFLQRVASFQVWETEASFVRMSETLSLQC